MSSQSHYGWPSVESEDNKKCARSHLHWHVAPRRTASGVPTIRACAGRHSRRGQQWHRYRGTGTCACGGGGQVVFEARVRDRRAVSHHAHVARAELTLHAVRDFRVVLAAVARAAVVRARRGRGRGARAVMRTRTRATVAARRLDLGGRGARVRAARRLHCGCAKPIRGTHTPTKSSTSTEAATASASRTSSSVTTPTITFHRSAHLFELSQRWSNLLICLNHHVDQIFRLVE
jgi:hypothetical protein